jgi:hypothetical protein
MRVRMTAADVTPDFEQVVVVSGHMVDQPGRTPPRFPPEAEPLVTAAVRAALHDWKVGDGTLVVSGGARGADIIAAEQALSLGAAVWLLVALPDDEFIAASVDLPGTDWTERYESLRRRCPTRFQHVDLGPPGPGQDVFERNNDWCLAVAREAAPTDSLRALVVWDGVGGDGRGGTADFVDRARQLGAQVVVIDPADPG